MFKFENSDFVLNMQELDKDNLLCGMDELFASVGLWRVGMLPTEVLSDLACWEFCLASVSKVPS